MPWITVHNATDQPLVVDHQGRQVPARGYGSAQSEQPYVAAYVERNFLIPLPPTLLSDDPDLSAEVAAAIRQTEALAALPYPEIPTFADVDLGRLTLIDRLEILDRRLRAIENGGVSGTATQVGAIPATEKGAPGGVAALGADRRVLPLHLPPGIDVSQLATRQELAERVTRTELTNTVEIEAAARRTGDTQAVAAARDAASVVIGDLTGRLAAVETRLSTGAPLTTGDIGFRVAPLDPSRRLNETYLPRTPAPLGDLDVVLTSGAIAVGPATPAGVLLRGSYRGLELRAATAPTTGPLTVQVRREDGTALATTSLAAGQRVLRSSEAVMAGQTVYVHVTAANGAAAVALTFLVDRPVSDVILGPEAYSTGTPAPVLAPDTLAGWPLGLVSPETHATLDLWSVSRGLLGRSNLVVDVTDGFWGYFVTPDGTGDANVTPAAAPYVLAADATTLRFELTVPRNPHGVAYRLLIDVFDRNGVYIRTHGPAAFATTTGLVFVTWTRASDAEAQVKPRLQLDPANTAGRGMPFDGVQFRLTGVGPVPVGPVVTGRDVTLFPFHETAVLGKPSVFNLGVAVDVQLEAVTGALTSAVRSTAFVAWAYRETHSHTVYQASSSDPLIAVTDPTHQTDWLPAGGTVSLRIPAAAAPAEGTDAHLHVINPERTHVFEMFGFRRTSATTAQCSRFHRVDLRGTGVGPMNGVRAFGGSAIGGLVRAHEVDPTHPRYTGALRHAIAMALDNVQLGGSPRVSAEFGWDYHLGGGGPVQGWGEVANRAGFSKQLGYVFPATEQDYGAPDPIYGYKGSVPIGTVFVIPGSVDITTLGLTPEGRMLAGAFRDYGGIVTDQAEGVSLCYVENHPGSKPWADTVRAQRAGGSDLDRIRAQLVAVTNSTLATPLGGAVGAARRVAPLAPVS